VTIKAPYLPYDLLRIKAQDFLIEHHPSGTIPIPIAAIVEFQFNMDIVTIPGLLESLDVDSSISSDLTTIYIDERVFKKYPTRYHFSVAHELSHLLIHEDVFRQLHFGNLNEWKAAMASIPQSQYTWIEQQAYNLAGLILVPPEHLSNAYARCKKDAEAVGISLAELDSQAIKIICANIGREFEVSAAVICKRLKFDKLADWECRDRD
jgi:Zn-dependent peptidase ImmA (M78 family)